MNKILLLSSASLLALTCQNAKAVTCQNASNCVTTLAQIQADYNSALNTFKAANIVPSSYWNNVQETTAFTGAPVLGQFNAYLNKGGGVITLDNGNYGQTNLEVETTAAHELGHAVTAELTIAYDNAVTKYGANSSQAITASIAAENAADVVAASVMGLQNFVNQYLGNSAPGGDVRHGTLLDQLAAISAANPGVVLSVPQSVLTEQKIPTTAGQIITIDGGKTADIPLENVALPAQKLDVSDDSGTDTEKSVIAADGGDGGGDGDGGDGGDGDGGDGGDGDGDGGDGCAVSAGMHSSCED